MKKDSKIVIFGGNGLLGSAVKRVLAEQDFENIKSPRSSEIDLLEKDETENYLKVEQPGYIFMTAGLVGGILGNKTRPADFLYQNSMMILNLLEGVRKFSPKSKILYTGSTCIYPKESPQPINEDRFMSGKLEETNKGYAVAKGMGIVACQSYRRQYGLDAICAMPTNMYGLNDNYDLENGHMIPSLIKKFLVAKGDGNNVSLWGSGNPRREALYSEDCADAMVYLMDNYSSEKIVNIGTGFDYSIREFANIIKGEIGGKYEIEWIFSKPGGTFEKRTDIDRLKGIYPEFNPRGLREGIRVILNNKRELERILGN
ncbi:GDP-L-fucose synthase [Candidatus Pacearchaeota archaeon]|nr:GDP-L-fucose synthase [Candidatus Pacearchaeota archaeon]